MALRWAYSDQFGRYQTRLAASCLQYNNNAILICLHTVRTDACNWEALHTSFRGSPDRHIDDQILYIIKGFRHVQYASYLLPTTRLRIN